MSTPKRDKRELLIDELTQVLDGLKKLRSAQLSEIDDTTRKDYLAKRMELARKKMEDLRTLQKRDKEVRDRRREIGKQNKRNH